MLTWGRARGRLRPHFGVIASARSHLCNTWPAKLWPERIFESPSAKKGELDMSRKKNLGSWMILVFLFAGFGAQAHQDSTPQDKSQVQVHRSVASDPELPRSGPDAGPAQNVAVPRLIKFSSTANDELGHALNGV